MGSRCAYLLSALSPAAGDVPEGPGCGVVLPVISDCCICGDWLLLLLGPATGPGVPGVLPPPRGVALPGLNWGLFCPGEAGVPGLLGVYLVGN